MKREILEIEDCPDCGAKPGEVHADGCDIELCSDCGLQKIGCNHKGDKQFQRWTGLYPGTAEAIALGFVTESGHADLNKLFSSGLFKVLWVKPK